MIEGKHNLEICSNKSKLRQCRYSFTEYQTDIQKREGRNSIYTITKWLDPGEGRTLLDSKWWSHLSDAYTNNRAFAAAKDTYSPEET
jgi:hypothetical protein